MAGDREPTTKKKDSKNPAKDLYNRAQESLVACLLASKQDVSEVFEIVGPDDFEEPKFELIYSAAMELSRQSEAIDAYTVGKVLESRGELATVDGLRGLQQLILEGHELGLEAPIKMYAKILKEYASKERVRKLIEEYEEVFQGDSGQSAADGLSELQARLNEQLYKISNDSNVAEISDEANGYEELLDKRKQISEENAELADGLQGIPSLLPSLNKYTTGWKPGQLITIAAKTGVGKSVFAINAAVAAIQANKSVMFFSLEMSVEEINDRIFSSISSIPMNDLKQGKLDDGQREVLKEAISELKHSKLTIDPDPKQTIDSIRAKALKKAQSPEGLDFIIIDYLNLITPTGRFGSRQEAVADMARNLKLISKVFEVPVMILTQMNRAETDNEDGIPTIDNIRESAATGQDSDVVIILHRKKAMDEDIPPTYVVLAKQRNGEADKIIKCHSHLECSVFREMVVKKDLDAYSDEEMDSFDEELESQIGDMDDELGEEDWDEFD